MAVRASRLSLVSMAAVLAIGVSSPADAGLVYDNGPLGPTTAAFAVFSGFSISDSFTLTESTTLQAATAGLWTYGQGETPPGADYPTGVGWSIGSTPFGVDLGTGFSATTNVSLGQSDFHYSDGTRFDVFASTFSISANLGPGTYYLTLANATSARNYAVEWSVNGGPSSAYTSFSGGDPASSEFFQLFGIGASAVPEPTSLAEFAFGGIAVITCFGLRRRRIAS